MDRHTFLINTFYVVSAGMTIPNLPFNLFRIHNSHKKEFDRLFSSLDSGFLLTKYAEELGSEYLSYRKIKTVDENPGFELITGQSPQTLILQAGLPAFCEIQAKIQSDFDTGNTIRIQGWILSDTEAKLCALYTLTT